MSRCVAVVLVFSFFLIASARGQDSPDRLAQLEARIAALEARLAELEHKLAEAAKTPDPQALKAQARAAFNRRVAQDLTNRSRDELAEAERLYQTANKDWNSPEAKAALEQMVAKFPDINRTGCAVLYLGQMAEGDEKVRLLQQVIDQYPDCYYGDGTQTGPYAMYHLGMYYLGTGRPDLARPLFERLRNDHPHAIGHRGEILVQSLPE